MVGWSHQTGYLSPTSALVHGFIVIKKIHSVWGWSWDGLTLPFKSVCSEILGLLYKQVLELQTEKNSLNQNLSLNFFLKVQTSWLPHSCYWDELQTLLISHKVSLCLYFFWVYLKINFSNWHSWDYNSTGWTPLLSFGAHQKIEITYTGIPWYFYHTNLKYCISRGIVAFTWKSGAPQVKYFFNSFNNINRK